MSEGYWLRQGRLNRRRLLAGGAGALAVAGLAGCGRSAGSSGGAASSGQPQAASEAPRPGGTLVDSQPYNPPLDPQRVSAAAQQAVGGSYSRIFRFKTGADPKVITNHDIENDLGVSMESPDAVTWTIKIRPDATFHNVAPVNGHAVEAEDIKSSFTRALDPANPNRGALNMIDPAQIQTPDKTTVVFKLAYPYAPFRKTLASPTYSQILPREALAGGFDPTKVVIGSGPFIADALTPDVASIFKKNPAWFEKGQPYVDALKIAVVPDRSQQLAQFSAGSLDVLILDNTDDVSAVQQRTPKAQVFKAQRASPFPIYFQMGDPSSPFQDIRLRRAVSMALDRATLAKVVFNGQAEQPVFVPSYMGKWSVKVPDLPADLQKNYQYNPGDAKQLLQAAGAEGIQLRLAYLINGPTNFAPSPIYKKHVETVGNMLNEIGLKVSLITHDYNKDFVDAGKGSRQGYFDKDVMMFASAGSYSDADEWLYAYFHSKSTSNQEHLSDSTYDAMVDKQRTLVNEDERLNAVIAIHKYLAEKMYAPSTVGTYEWAVVSPRISNYQYSNSLGKYTETYAKAWAGA
jgi:peptide/nickel transport system substrate-binding protein